MTFCQVKYFVLFLLVLQNTCLVLLMRHSRTRPGTMYLASTAVCCDEAMKLVACFVILTFTYYCQMSKEVGGGRYVQLSTREDKDSSNVVEGVDEEYVDRNCATNENIDDAEASHYGSFREYLREQLTFDYRLGGIALIYTVQKNLLYLGISNLDAAIFQVTYQAKILTTALFSVLLLKKRLSYQKIGALLLLTLGVALEQFDKVETNASKSNQDQRQWVGMLAVLGACCTSGFGGVYFELVLKPQNNLADASGEQSNAPSVWAKNLQLSAFSIVIALVTTFIKDQKAISSEGFFQGYSPLVVTVITLQAGGGLVVAAIIKYADNILKSFASAVSILTSTMISAWVFGFVISKVFAGCCVLVLIAIGLYSRDDGDARTSGTKFQHMNDHRQQIGYSINRRNVQSLTSFFKA